MSEFIGSRISLISKSDIRYVGRLHEINSENSTVALEDVQPFGTEGRRGGGADEIPPSDARYEYILFRGSDVKDLRIEEAPKEQGHAPQMPDDPAILGSARPMGAGPPGPPQHGQPPNMPPGPPPPFGAYPPYPPMNQGFGRGFPPGPPGPPGPGGFPGYPGPNMPYGAPPPGWYPPPGQGPPPQFSGHHGPFAPAPQMPTGPPGRGSQDTSNNKPTEAKELGTDAPISKGPAGLSQNKQNNKAPTPPVESKPDVAAALAPTTSKAPMQILKNPSNSAPTGPKAQSLPAVPRQGQGRPMIPSGPSMNKPSTSQIQDATQAATAAVAAAMAKLPNAGRPAPQPDITIDNLAQRVQHMRTDENGGQRPRQASQGGPHNNAQRGRRGGHRGGRDHHGLQKVEIPDTEFDFESANAKFSKSDLVKEVIASGSPLDTPAGESNGNGLDATLNASSVERKESNAGEDIVIPAAANAYDKKSSFFDNISSELKDKQEAQGRVGGGMEFRSQERQRNMETFGQGSVDSYRGGFRGRGRGRGGFRGRGQGQGQGFGRGRGGGQGAGVPAQMQSQ